MPRGAAVIRYQGKRGAVWRLQYRDAAGRYVKETLGREPHWNKTKAERELGKRLAEIEARPELIDAYISLMARQGLSAKTIRNHLLLLNLMLRRATVWRLIRSNPLMGIDQPRLAQPEMNVLTEVEIARLIAAYDELG